MQFLSVRFVLYQVVKFKIVSFHFGLVHIARLTIHSVSQTSQSADAKLILPVDEMLNLTKKNCCWFHSRHFDTTEKVQMY